MYELEELKEIRMQLEIAFENAKKDDNIIRKDKRLSKLKHIWAKTVNKIYELEK